MLQRTATSIAPGFTGFGGFGGFGAPATAPSGFGAPAAAPSGFGAPAAAPSGGFGGFGAPAAAPSGFGAPAAASSGFGAPAGPGGTFASPASPAYGGFGAPGAPGATPGGFASPASPGFGAPAATGTGFGIFASPASPGFGAPVQTAISFAQGTGVGSGHSTYKPFRGTHGANTFSQQYGTQAPGVSPTSGAYAEALRESRLGAPREAPTMFGQVQNWWHGTRRQNLPKGQYYAQNTGRLYSPQSAVAAGQQMAQPQWRGWGGKKSTRRHKKRKSTRRRGRGRK